MTQEGSKDECGSSPRGLTEMRQADTHWTRSLRVSQRAHVHPAKAVEEIPVMDQAVSSPRISIAMLRSRVAWEIHRREL